MMTSGRPSSSSAPTYSWAPTTSVSASSKRIHREMVELNNDPPPHCSATIIGPPGWLESSTNHYQSANCN
ncbi:hypothetical protein AAHE18_08G135400 [Arachis hypogaea]